MARDQRIAHQSHSGRADERHTPIDRKHRRLRPRRAPDVSSFSIGASFTRTFPAPRVEWGVSGARGPTPRHNPLRVPVDRNDATPLKFTLVTRIHLLRLRGVWRVGNPEQRLAKIFDQLP